MLCAANPCYCHKPLARKRRYTWQLDAGCRQTNFSGPCRDPLSDCCCPLDIPWFISSAYVKKRGALNAHTELMLHLLTPSAICILKADLFLVQIPNPTSDILIVIFKCIIVTKDFSLKKTKQHTPLPPRLTLPGSYQPSHLKRSSGTGGWSTSVQNAALRERCPRVGAPAKPRDTAPWACCRARGEPSRRAEPGEGRLRKREREAQQPHCHGTGL